MLARVGEYLRVVHEVTGLAAYDPQTESILGPEQGFRPPSGIYAVAKQAQQAPPKKPWWRFW